MHIVDHIALRSEENSRCLSLARVRKASRPSIKSHGMSGSGSMMGGRELAEGPAIRRITKNTSLCFSIVAYSFWERSLETLGIPGFFLLPRLKLLLFLLVFLLFFFLAFLLSPLLTSVLSLLVFSSLFRSSSSCSSSLMLSSRTLGQKSPSK